MAPQPTITVAIPSYNKAPFIRRCIESVLANDAFVDQIILVDNCSTDETFTIAKEYEPRVICYRNESNLGMAGNFNRCIALCTTDWLLILHADDELLKESISLYRKTITENPGIGLIHADCYFQQEHSVDLEYIPRPTYGFFTAGTHAMSCHYGACSSVMVQRDAYKTLGNFIESMSCDTDMWARIASRYDIYSLSTPTVIYHVSSASTGPQSLVNRSVHEIRKDWENLNARMLTLLSNEQERQAYSRQIFLNGPATYWPVLTANIRARHWRNVLAALKVISIDYRGGIYLVRRVISTVFRYVVPRR